MQVLPDSFTAAGDPAFCGLNVSFLCGDRKNRQNIETEVS